MKSTPLSWPYSSPRYYTIPHIAISAPSIDGKSADFEIDGKRCRVEAIATQFLSLNGYEVFNGDVTHVVLAFLSYNFSASFFADTAAHYLSLNGHDARQILSTLEGTVERFFAGEDCINDLIDQAEAAACKYQGTFTSKINTITAICTALRTLRPVTLKAILCVHRAAGYTTKGAPDLFATRDGSPLFAEVKSLNDSLRPEQYQHFELLAAAECVEFCVIRVLPSIINQSHPTAPGFFSHPPAARDKIPGHHSPEARETCP